MTLRIAIFTLGAWGFAWNGMAQQNLYVADEEMVLATTDKDASEITEAEEKYSKRIFFENVENDKIQNSFLRVIESYEILDGFAITLVRKPIKSSTMQAQPELSLKALFGGTKRYRIKFAMHVRDSDEFLVEDLPKDVLTGWFAHELGHIADYGSTSNFGMLWFGIKYVLSPKFKRKAEHAADLYAIEHGFYREIIAVKRFILERDFLSVAYKEKIQKYYMSIEEVESYAADNVDAIPVVSRIDL